MFRLVIVLSCAVAVFGQLAEEAHPAPEPYSFAFSSPNEDGTSSSREETGDASGRVTGSYTIQGADGQSRRVEYVADENGFRANVITNEIGTESQNTADVQVQSSAPTAAELTAQWEASGAGRARLAAPQQVLARPDIGLARGAGLVSAPIAPIVGGAIGGQNLRFSQGFGLRAPAVGLVAARRAIVPAPLPAPVAPVEEVAPVAPIAPVPVAARLTPFPAAGFIRAQGLTQLGGASLPLNQFSLGVAQQQLPLGQGLGLGLRGFNLAGLQNGQNGLLLVSNGGQLVSGRGQLVPGGAQLVSGGAQLVSNGGQLLTRGVQQLPGAFTSQINIADRDVEETEIQGRKY